MSRLLVVQSRRSNALSLAMQELRFDRYGPTPSRNVAAVKDVRTTVAFAQYALNQ
jgi:hypothetical protein